MRTMVVVTVALDVLHPEGSKVTKKEIISRVRRLLDERESDHQPDDFYLTNPSVIVKAL